MNEQTNLPQKIGEINDADPANGNIVVKQPTFAEFYQNISTEKFDDKSIEILTSPVDENDVEIRPDGLIYLPEIKYRRILNKSFGVGAWSLIQMNTIIDYQQSVVFYDGALFIQGRYHARATGEMKYIAKNENMTWATALEGAKSDCLTRCCKDLGVASELWDKQFINGWIEKYAIKVWCVNQKEQSKKKPLWRKKTEKPIDIYPWKEQNGKADSSQKKPVSQQKTTQKTLTKEQKDELEKAKSALFDLIDDNVDLISKTKFDKAKNWGSKCQDIKLIKEQTTLFSAKVRAFRMLRSLKAENRITKEQCDEWYKTIDGLNKALTVEDQISELIKTYSIEHYEQQIDRLIER